MSITGILFCGVVLIEFYFWYRWNLLYFSKGLLLYKHTLPSENSFNGVAKNVLSENIDDVICYKNLRIKKISDTEISIRKKYFLTLPVRGRFVYYKTNSEAKVYVYLHWYALYMYIFIVLLISKDIFSHPVSVCLGLFGWSIAMYLILVNSLVKEIDINKFDPW